MTSPQLSIIIPVINEAELLPRLLDQLQRQELCNYEILVADGGSDDHSVAIALSAGVRCIHSSKGRGKQMNAATREALGKDLLFLHADSRLSSPRLLIDAITVWDQKRLLCNHDRMAGHFPLRFSHQPAGQQKIFRFYEEKTTLNRPDCIHGDQGLLISKRFFLQLGTFDESVPFLEDQKLADKIHAEGIWITLPGYLETSARRFVGEGFARRMLVNALIMAFHHTGFHEFFALTPAIYRQQDHTKPLKMTPIFQNIIRLNRAQPWPTSLRRWLKIGEYARKSAWQLFFLLDVHGPRSLGWRTDPFLTFHDRVVQPLTNFKLFDILAALLTWLCFSTTRLYFHWLERDHHVPHR